MYEAVACPTNDVVLCPTTTSGINGGNTSSPTNTSGPQPASRGKPGTAIDTQHRRGSPCRWPQKREGKKQVSKSYWKRIAYILGPYPPARKQDGGHRAERVLFDLRENRLDSKSPFFRGGNWKGNGWGCRMMSGYMKDDGTECNYHKSWKMAHDTTVRVEPLGNRTIFDRTKANWQFASSHIRASWQIASSHIPVY